MTDDAPLPLSRKLAYLRDICNIQMTNWVRVSPSTTMIMGGMG